MARPRPRLWALGAVLAVAAAGIAVALALTGEEGRRPSETGGQPAPSLDSLEPAWTAAIDRGGVPGPEFAHTGIVLVVSTDHGLYAFDKGCGTAGAECDPLWIGDISTDDPAPAASQGVVYEATEQGLFAFQVDCGSEGAKCEPLWTGPVPSDSNGAFEPVVAEDVVKVSYSFGEGREHEVHATAFPTGCGTDGETCEPLWTAPVGNGSAYFGALAVEGTFFQQVGSDLVGFGAHCASGGEACRPSFQWPTGGETVSGPVEGGGELLVTTYGGSLHAFPPECPELPCRPLWNGHTGGPTATPPVVSSDTAFVTAGPSVHAFPLGCRSDGGECPSDWTATVEGVELLGVAHADERRVIAVSLTEPGSIWAFPSRCAQPCSPLWTAETGARLGRVEVVGGKVFAGTYDGAVLVYPAGCAADGSECPVSWSASVPGRISELFVDSSGIYVVSWGGDDLPRKHGTITAFRE